MVFDPAAFENLEALQARNDREADEAQINAKLAEDWIDLEWAKNLMYWDLQARTPEEIEAAKIAEANEPDADEELMAALEWEEAWDKIQWEHWEDTIVWSQWNDTIQNAEQVEIDVEQQKALKNWIFSPRIDSLVLQWELWDITSKEIETLKTTLLSGNIEDIDSIPESELSNDKKWIVIEKLSESEDPANQIEYSKNFIQDFGSELKDFQNAKWEFTSDLDQSAFKMISARYITPLEWEVSVEDKKIALDTAFNTALNTELHGKQIRETESFKQICRDIRNDTLPIWKKFSAFKELLSFTSLEQWKWWKRQETLYRKRAAEQMLTDSWRLERFNELLTLFHKQNEWSNRSIEIAQELEAIRLESGVSSWDASLLAGGEAIDIVTDDISENTQESA